MTEQTEHELELSKMCQVRRMTADGLICDCPCYLFDVEMNGAAGGAATATVYDGHNTNGKVIADLLVITSLSQNYPYHPPVYCKQGLYVDVGSNVTSVIFHFLAVKE